MVKRIVTFLVLLIAAATAFGQNTPTYKPFFFPKGIYQPNPSDPQAPFQQLVEYDHIFQGTWACNQGGGNLIPGSASYTVKTDVASTSSITNPNTTMTIVLDHFYKQADGTYRVTSLCGQDFVTQEQVDGIVANLKQLVVAASQNDNAFYQVILDKAVTARAMKLGLKREELVAQLDEKVPGYPITFRELHRLPKPSKASDFVPRELHLGYNPPLGGILGVTWLNTGVIYFNPEAWMVDYVLIKPVIMQHEMVHCNVNVEKFPMSEAFDAELMADMPMTFYPENMINFQNHGYNKELREFAEIYFGFDWDQYRADVVKFNFEGNVQFDEPKYLAYYKQIVQIKAELLKFYEDTTIPEFYSDPVWWSAVNDIRGDNNSVFRMTLADHYNPTILGGAAKTMDFINANADEIKAITKRAFEAGLGGKGSGEMAMVTPAMREQYDRMFTADEQAKIEAYFTQHPEKVGDLKKMSPTDLMQFLATFKNTSMKGSSIQ